MVDITNDIISKIEKQLSLNGLKYQNRKFFRRDNECNKPDLFFIVQAVMSLPITSKELNISELFDTLHITFDISKYRKAMINNQKEKLIDIKTIYSKDGDKSILIVTEEGINTIKNALIEIDTSNTLDEEETDIEKSTNNIYITPNLTYSSFFRKFEKLYCRSQEYEDEMFICKNPSMFRLVDNNQSFVSQKNYPIRMIVKIELIIPVKAEKSLRYEVENSKGEVKYFFESDKILDLKDEGEGFNVSEIFKHPVVSVKYYVYKFRIKKKDGSFDKDLEYLETFTPNLVPGIYEVIGYAQTGKHLKISYFEGYYFKLLDSNTMTNLVYHNDKHKFFQLYNFFINHIKSKNFNIEKGRSDGIVWMETLMTIVQFSGYDKKRMCHSLYAGFQDVGKSYITQLFGKIKFTQVKTLTSQRFSVPGLFGAANRDIELPNERKIGQAIHGDFSGDLVIFEELGSAVVDPNSEFHKNIDMLKHALFNSEIDNSKVNGTTSSRTAYAKFIMNYSNAWKSTLRSALKDTITQLEREYNSKKLSFGENNSITAQNIYEFVKPRSSVLHTLAEQEDLFKDFSQYYETEFLISNGKIKVTEIEAKLFKKSIQTLRETYEKQSIDIYTSLPFAFKKRVLFSLYGLTKETNEDASFESLSQFDEEDLYIPTLKQHLYDNIRAKEKQFVNEDKLNKTIKRLFDTYAKKYSYLASAVGGNTFGLMFSMVLKALMLYNDEFDKPGIDTLRLVEKWIYLQCTPLESKVIANYRLLEKQIPYVTTQEFYESFNWDGTTKNGDV